MAPRRSLKLPITLAIVMTVLLGVLTVGWVLLAVFGAEADQSRASQSWAFLAIGTSFIGLLLVGVVLYLILTIKAINLGRRQSNFIDSVTHELKSPIASLKLYLQTLSRRRVADERRQDFYGLMLQDLARLDDLINQMLDAGRLETDRFAEEWEDVPLDEVIRECAGLTCRHLRVPPEVIRLELSPCSVRGCRSQLVIVFRNLLDNAVRYAGKPPDVKVSLEPDQRGRVVARVADNGPGIPPRLRRRVFGRFVRLGSELERRKTGTGLGLYIARTILSRLRGRIRVRDRSSGPGAVFEVRLPALPVAAAPLEVTPRES